MFSDMLLQSFFLNGVVSIALSAFGEIRHPSPRAKI